MGFAVEPVLRSSVEPSLAGQSPPNLIMGLELTGVHTLTDLAAMGPEGRTPLDEEVDEVVVEREQGITPLILGFQQHPLPANRLEEVSDRLAGVTDGLDGHDDPPR